MARPDFGIDIIRRETINPRFIMGCGECLGQKIADVAADDQLGQQPPGSGAPHRIS